MSDVFIVDLFIFKLTKILPYFATSNQHFTGMPECTKYMILNTAFDIHNANNLHPFSIFKKKSFLRLCVSRCVA